MHGLLPRGQGKGVTAVQTCRSHFPPEHWPNALQSVSSLHKRHGVSAQTGHGGGRPSRHTTTHGRGEPSWQHGGNDPSVHSHDGGGESPEQMGHGRGEPSGHVLHGRGEPSWQHGGNDPSVHSHDGGGESPEQMGHGRGEP